ncbi:Kv channel-interacting protein 1-like [Penaeus chinensis]|uniref:Kv channel-interacting protein 1-like n=1 Tax=Penaeus chinensis TaxID=139456 RepID=UPI001FB6C026|nr:Kv channel-interacting protein 1-like [Penaeus chinensis]
MAEYSRQELPMAAGDCRVIHVFPTMLGVQERVVTHGEEAQGPHSTPLGDSVNLLLGQQSGFTKYPSFLCMGDGKDKANHYTKDWPAREEVVLSRARNIINNILVDRDRIVLPLLHIKLDLLQQFTKALDKDGGCLTYLCRAVPGLTTEKLKSVSSSVILILKTQNGKHHDPDDIELSVVRYKPDGIDALARTTKFSKKDLQLIYRGFKAECPNGFVSEETFKGIYSQFFPQGDATAYAHYVFNAFDVEQQGSISFEEFVTILSELSRGSVTEKLRWAFNLYDINGDGYITKEEMLDIVTAIYSLVGRNAIPAVEENTTQEHVDRIFEKLDINGDGMVTLDEFMEICTQDETIANSLTILDTNF